MIKWQEYRPKKDIIKPFVLFNLLKRNDDVNIKRLCSVPTEKRGGLGRAVRKLRLMGDWELCNLLPREAEGSLG